MTTTYDPDHDILTFPFSAATDFVDLADYCDRFALLRPQLGEPIPEHLMDRFPAETLPH